MRGNVQADLFDDQVVIPSLEGALTGLPSKKGCHVETSYYSAPEVDLALYDHVIVCLSGGKDSIAAYLRLLDMGVDRSKVEFWHHDVDGREGSSLMDWGFMRDYCNQLAEVFQVPLYFSWLEGGFEGELCLQSSTPR